MNRAQAVERLEALREDLQRDVDAAQTRQLHIALSQRVNEVQRIVAELRAPA